MKSKAEMNGNLHPVYHADEITSAGEYSYRGKVYVRPCGRGACTEDFDEPNFYLEELAALVAFGQMDADGYCELEITIRRIEKTKAQNKQGEPG